MNIEFPVFIFAKDSSEIQRFESVYDLQCQLEEIDVENAEYLAWDKNGNPILLAVQKPIWLKLEPVTGSPQPDLKSCLEKYATTVGVQVGLKESSPQEFKRAYEQIAAEAKRRTRPNIFSRLTRRR